MDIQISNVIINYFLIHDSENFLSKKHLNYLTKNICNNFRVNIIDNTDEGIKKTVQIFSDFLSLDENNNIIQNNIINYLDELQPIYSYSSFKQWDQQFEYYNFLRKN